MCLGPWDVFTFHYVTRPYSYVRSFPTYGYIAVKGGGGGDKALAADHVTGTCIMTSQKE